MMRDWSKEKLKARIAKARDLIAALDACLEVDWSGSVMERQAGTLRKYRTIWDTNLKNMEHVLEEKKE